MINFGTVRPGTTLYIPFATYATATGASITQTGLAVTDVECYKSGSTTTRSSDNGYTLLDTDGIDFAGITGIHGFSISLADNSVAGFWAAGSDYFVVVSTITVDGNNVSFIACRFTIGYEDAIINTTIATLSSQTSFTLTAEPAEDDALNGMEVVIHDVASAVQLGRAVILDYTGSTKTVTLAAATTFTAAATDNISVMGVSPASLVSGTAVWATTARVLTAATNITSTGGAIDLTAGGCVGIDWGNVENQSTLVNFNDTTLARVGVINTNGIATDSFAANSITASALASDAVAEIQSGLSTLTAAGVRTAVGLASANLDTQLDAIPTAAETWAAAGRTLTAIDEDSTTLDLDATIRAAVGMSSANLDTQIGDVPTNAELATAIITALTTALTEGYRTAGSTASVRDMLYEIIQGIHDSSISGTTKTIRNLAGSAAKTFTLDHATTPTSITETT